MHKRSDARGNADRRRQLIGLIIGSLQSIPVAYVVTTIGVVILSENGSPSFQGSFIGLLVFAAWTGIGIIVAIAAGVGF